MADDHSECVPDTGSVGLDQDVTISSAPAHRTKPPGVKRLLVTLSTLVGFLSGMRPSSYVKA